MDGNGRWAQARGLPRVEGHRAGAKTVREITTYCRELGIEYLTLYAFSSENWGRPEDEVEALMALLKDYLVEERSTLLDNEIRLTHIGDISRMPDTVQSLIRAVEEATAHCDKMLLTLALSYGGRGEIVRAVQKLAASGSDLRALDDDTLSAALDTAGTPDPDLLLRTSGEQRISNFLLWQVAYAELFFEQKPWPDFTKADLDRALESFQKRERRFGLTGAQVSS